MHLIALLLLLIARCCLCCRLQDLLSPGTFIRASGPIRCRCFDDYKVKLCEACCCVGSFGLVEESGLKMFLKRLQEDQQDMLDLIKDRERARKKGQDEAALPTLKV